MRQIIRRREVVADDVRYSTDEAIAGMRLVRPLADLIGASGQRLDSQIAVLLGPTDELEPLLPFLSRITLIVIDFPQAGDGRGFSQARVLRQRYRYAGELRARGVLKRDQLFFLARGGFDAFDLDPSENLQESLAAFNSFSVAYQDGSNGVVQVRQRSAVF